MSTTLWIQLGGLVFGITFIYFTFLNFKKKYIEFKEFMLWVILWLILIIVSFVPDVLNPLVSTLRFYRKLDLFAVVGIGFLTAISFFNYLIVKRNQKKVETVVREVAFMKAEEMQKRKK